MSSTCICTCTCGAHAVKDFTTREKMAVHGNFLHEDNWHVGLDLGLIDPENLSDMRVVCRVLCHLTNKYPSGPIEMFGCLFSYETAEELVYYVDRYIQMCEEEDYLRY